MAVNYKEFSTSLDSMQEKIKDEVEKIIKDVVTEIFTFLKPDTPIDTGWARSNWIISIDMPRPFPVGSKLNVSSAISEQNRSFATFINNSLNNVSMIYINNGVPYISLLNNGTSAQAPKNFVRISVEKGLRKLNKNRTIK